VQYAALILPVLLMAGLFGLARVERWVDKGRFSDGSAPTNTAWQPEPAPALVADRITQAEHESRRRPPIRTSTRPATAGFVGARAPRRRYYHLLIQRYRIAPR